MQSKYGEQWPLTDPEGVMAFLVARAVLTVSLVLRVGEEIYAVNDSARDTGKALEVYRELVEIWRDQPTGTDDNVPVPDELIRQGLSI